MKRLYIYLLAPLILGLLLGIGLVLAAPAVSGGYGPR